MSDTKKKQPTVRDDIERALQFAHDNPLLTGTVLGAIAGRQALRAREKRLLKNAGEDWRKHKGWRDEVNEMGRDGLIAGAGSGAFIGGAGTAGQMTGENRRKKK